MPKKKAKSHNSNQFVANYTWRQAPSFLWGVWIIAGEEVWLDKKVVAMNKQAATFKAGVFDVLKEKQRDPSQVKIIAKPIFNLNEEGDV